MNTIIGLEKPIEDQGTGATLAYHVVHVYQVDVIAKTTAATLASWISRAHFTAGKRNVSHVSVSVPIVPVGDPVQWIYQALLAATTDGNALAGAEPVFDEPAPGGEA